MWALRRASKSIRCHGYRVGAPRACCAKPDVLSDDLQHGLGNHERGQFIAIRYLLPKSFLCVPSVPAKFFVGSRNLSSKAGARSSGDEDDLEEGFSELETPPDVHGVGENHENEVCVDELVSEPKLSDDESEDSLLEPAHNELDLSDDETGMNGGNESQKSATCPLFEIVAGAPFQSIHIALDKWVTEGNTVDHDEILNAMYSLRKHRIFGKALKLMEWVVANNRLDLTEHDYASLVDLIAKVHGLYSAEKYIEMRVPKSFQGEVIYRTLLANCVTAQNRKKTEEVFNKMRVLGFPLTDFSYNQLFLLYKQYDRKKIGDVLLLMEKENVKPNLFTYRLLIDIKGRAKDIAGMEQVLDAMKAEGVRPNASIQAAVAGHYIFKGHYEKAEAVLKELEGGDLEANRAMCCKLLPLYAALGKVDEVGRVWKACEVSPRLEECVAAIMAWGKVGHVEKAEAVFEMIIKTWKKVTSKHYPTLLRIYADHKMLAKGKDLVKRMLDNGIRLGPLTWTAIVKLYADCGEVEKADSILQKVAQQTVAKPMYGSYITLLDKYAEKGDIHNAEKIFHRLRQHGYVGRIQPYQFLLQAYINAKTPVYGFRERIKADGIVPNKTVAAQLAKIDPFMKSPNLNFLD
ncbi:pentatricopeptide repeat-containing protein At1g80270, mitochondrial-like [Magnolia sinica]|uniref:pentatricopeptide repeat-containing protein At1g80270, mitochondrial-like n=1 Tax=Magnolia sinica TaxID=86752 RepID=UPI00265B5996|nr:pentatricopeptide repeat-containing protein At1g80270, mitochondrial-like [Magnolia sinica]